MLQEVLQEYGGGFPVHECPGGAPREAPDRLDRRQRLLVEVDGKPRARGDLSGEGADPGGERRLGAFRGPRDPEDDPFDLFFPAEGGDRPGRRFVVPPLESPAGRREPSRGVRGREPDAFLAEVDRQNAHRERVAGC